MAEAINEEHQQSTLARPDKTASDVLMADAPAPASTRHTNVTVDGVEGQESHTASAHPEQGDSLPSHATSHGAPIRQYINGHVTKALLEGMKIIAKERPEDPLRVLGEYLIRRSQEEKGKD